MNKKKLKIMLCMLGTVMFLSYNVGMSAYAKDDFNYGGNNSNVCISEKEDIFKAKDTILSNEKNNIRGYSNLNIQVNTKYENKKYTMKDLNKLSYNELVNLIGEIKWNQITDLFEFNQDSVAFYSDKNRVQAIINELERRGLKYTDTDMKGIRTYVEVLRSGFYLGYYHDELNYLKERSYTDKCIPAILNIQKNPHFKLGTPVQDEIVTSVGKLIANASCNEEIVQRATPILVQFGENIEKYQTDRSKGAAWWDLIDGIRYDLIQEIYGREKTVKDSMCYGKIDDYITEFEKIVLRGNVNEDNGWIINNAIYQMGQIGRMHSNENKAKEVLTKALKIYPYLSEQYFEIANRFEYDLGGTDYYGNKIDVKKAKEDGKNKFLPNTYTFEDGKVIFRTGNKVSSEKIERLYWASREVKAQFHRMVGNDKPLESGNVDDILTVVIYNSPSEYKMNSTLYGYSTDNGGIYIEGDGTFFTYERTPQESIYSLEELFRHEFTHYLQGRYLEPGLWGRGELYANDQMAWFDEGSAEFFAGSTRTEGVKSRKSVVSTISKAPSERYTVSKTVHSKYGNWDFYHYSFAFNDLMYNKEWKIFKNIVNYLKNNNAAGYKNYMNTLGNDIALDKKYQSHMQYLVDNIENLTVPFVSDDYMVKYDYKNPSEIYIDIQAISKLTDVKTQEEKSQFFNSYTLSGTYTGDRSKGELDDWKDMNKKADELLKTLSASDWGGYKTLTCYFTNYRLDDQNRVQFDVVFHGKLGEEGQVSPENKAPIPKINVQSNTIVDSRVQFSSNGSIDEDGKIVKYLWDFGDGNTSTEENPIYSYAQSGKYNVKLQVTDDKGAISTVTSQIEVVEKVGENKAPIAKINLQPSAIVGDKINFSSNGSVDEDGTIVSYLWDFGDGNTSTEANLSYSYVTPGKYNVTLQITDDKGKTSVASKQVEITAKNEEPAPITTNEKEDNNGFENANLIDAPNTTIQASLDMAKDDRDTYKFKVNTPGEIKISLNNPNNLKMTWVLFDENDKKQYVAYGKENGALIEDTFVAKPGNYYLVAYVYENCAGTYSLNVKGDIGNKTSNNTGIVLEKECNNDFNSASGPIVAGTKVYGELNNDDNKDVYYFDVVNPGEINVSIENINNASINWVMYSENDLNNYVSYAVV